MERECFLNDSLDKLAKGYISHKIINGKQYFYLQAKEDGLVSSEYLKSENVEFIKEELRLRKQYEAEVSQIENRLEELMKAACIIGMGG